MSNAEGAGVIRRWECGKLFVLTEGSLNAAAESNLTRKDVRFVGLGPGGEPAYAYTSVLEAETGADAYDRASELLAALMAPYGVEIFVYESTVRSEGGWGGRGTER
jgi:hypothetical protein